MDEKSIDPQSLDEAREVIYALDNGKVPGIYDILSEAFKES